MALTKLEHIARDWHRAKSRERDAADLLYQAIREAHASGMAETQIAAAARVDRMTVRRALGKR